MTEETFDLDTYMASKGTLDFDPTCGRRTITLVPGRPGREKLKGVDARDLLFPDNLVDDILFDDAPFDAYPLTTSATFGWKGISDKEKAQTAVAILGSDIVYDELHPLAELGDDDDNTWSRTLAWYLVTRLAGNVKIRVRFRFKRPSELKDYVNDTLSMLDFKGFATIDADTLIPPDIKAVAALRNTFMSNFNAIGLRIIRAHMPANLPRLSDIQPHLSEESSKLLQSFRSCINQKRPFDHWAAHPSWLKAFFAFGKSTPEQRAVLYHILATSDKPMEAKVSIGDDIIGRSYVDAARGQVIRGVYVIEPIIDMISRGLLVIDSIARTLDFNESGHTLLETLKPLEPEFRYLEFFQTRDYKVDPDVLPHAQAWALDFFRSLKEIASQISEVSEAKE